MACSAWFSARVPATPCLVGVMTCASRATLKPSAGSRCCSAMLVSAATASGVELSGSRTKIASVPSVGGRPSAASFISC
jgi:hypothetical protein